MTDKLVKELMRRYQRLDKPLREVLEEAIEAGKREALEAVEKLDMETTEGDDMRIMVKDWKALKKEV